MNVALIVFAGTGSRIHSDIPKQFIKINGLEMVIYSIKKFNENPLIDEVDLVTSKEFIPYVACFKKKYHVEKINKVIEGGDSRQASVRLGLETINLQENDKILIHDGDRPLVSETLINQAISYLDEYEAACPFIYVKEEIPQISNLGRRHVYNGEEIHIQTPQSFRFGLIKNKHIINKDVAVSDDISLVDESMVKYYHGDKLNFKVTTDDDLEYLQDYLGNKDE